MKALPASQMKEIHPSKDNISKWEKKAKGKEQKERPKILLTAYLLILCVQLRATRTAESLLLHGHH